MGRGHHTPIHLTHGSTRFPQSSYPAERQKKNYISIYHCMETTSHFAAFSLSCIIHYSEGINYELYVAPHDGYYFVICVNW